MTKIDELRRKIELKRQLIDLTRQEIQWLSHDLGAALRREGLDGEHIESTFGKDAEAYTTIYNVYVEGGQCNGKT